MRAWPLRSRSWRWGGCDWLRPSVTVCAAISVSGRVSLLKELDRGEIEEQLFEVADRISVNLGHLGGTSVN